MIRNELHARKADSSSGNNNLFIGLFKNREFHLNQLYQKPKTGTNCSCL